MLFYLERSPITSASTDAALSCLTRNSPYLRETVEEIPATTFHGLSSQLLFQLELSTCPKANRIYQLLRFEVEIPNTICNHGFHRYTST